MARPASISATRSGVTLWDSGAYRYDGSGNLWKMGTAWFEYDALSRVKAGAVFPDPLGGGTQQKQTYAFDNYGNLQSISTQVGTGTPTTRYTSTSASTNRLTGAVAYDAAGNLTSWNGALYEYDAFDQMTRMVNGSEEWLYMYTADDERFWSFKPADGVYSRYDRFTLRGLDGEVLREFANPNYTWTSWQDYVYRDGQLLANYLSSGQRRHFHLDHLGSPRLVTNNAGFQVNYHAYFPFGEEATAFDPSTDRMKFTGHERDLASLSGTNPTADDLDYMHARHYSPLTGRFLSADPFPGIPELPQSWNRYAYVMGQATVLNDPTGLFGMPTSQSWLVWANAFTIHDTITVVASSPTYNFYTGVLGLGSLLAGRSFLDGLSAAGGSFDIYLARRQQEMRLTGQRITQYETFDECASAGDCKIGEVPIGPGGAGGLRNAKLLKQLTKLGNQAKGATGKQAQRLLKSMAEKAGLTVEKGGNHLVVFDKSGKMITQIPHSPTNPHTIRSIASKIVSAAKP
jgi:RHS repeat-associated protein